MNLKLTKSQNLACFVTLKRSFKLSGTANAKTKTMALFIRQPSSFICSILLSLIISTRSNLIDCNADCGPCSKDSSFCILDCEGQSCSSLQCNPDIPCIIQCDTEDDPSSTSCSEANISGQSSSSLNLYCKSESSCTNAIIHCPVNGDCDIDCTSPHLNDTNTCSKLHLICGSGLCQIDCSGGSKCDNITVNTSSASSFECIGNNNDCQAAPAPFIFTSTSSPDPTTSTTAQPTSDSNKDTPSPILVVTNPATTTAASPTNISSQIMEEMGDDVTAKKEFVALMTDMALIGLLTVLIALCLCFLYYMKRKSQAERKREIEDMINKQS